MGSNHGHCNVDYFLETQAAGQEYCKGRARNNKTSPYNPWPPLVYIPLPYFTRGSYKTISQINHNLQSASHLYKTGFVLHYCIYYVPHYYITTHYVLLVHHYSSNELFLLQTILFKIQLCMFSMFKKADIASC